MPFSRTIEWFEDLPENCPPNNAYSPNHDRFFRLAEQYPPTERDFFSQRKLYPKKPFHTSACRARSLSIFAELFECLNLLKLPAHRNKKVLQMTLLSESGAILQTGKVRAHYSWWRSKQYDPVSNCEKIEIEPK